jgi:hypothetical protein
VRIFTIAVFRRLCSPSDGLEAAVDEYPGFSLLPHSRPYGTVIRPSCGSCRIFDYKHQRSSSSGSDRGQAATNLTAV